MLIIFFVHILLVSKRNIALAPDALEVIKLLVFCIKDCKIFLTSGKSSIVFCKILHFNSKFYTNGGNFNIICTNWKKDETKREKIPIRDSYFVYLTSIVLLKNTPDNLWGFLFITRHNIIFSLYYFAM